MVKRVLYALSLSLQIPAAACSLLVMFYLAIDPSQLRMEDTAVITLKPVSIPHVLHELSNNWPGC